VKPPSPSPLPCISLAIVSGLLVRLVWMPSWARLGFDGHERLYLQAFEGSPPDPSAQAWPLLCWIYQGLGILSQDPRLLTVLSCLAGTAAIAGAALWAHRELGPKEGLWAALFVALLPDHAAWSTSPYHVILPNALLIWGFVLPRWWAGLCIALACSMRPELCVLAPLAGWPGIAGITGIAWWAALGAGVPGGSPWVSLQMNISLLGFLGPAILALALGGIKDRRCWGLFGMVALVHLSGSLFADYATRHALMGGVALCLICAAVVVRWTPYLGLICTLALGAETHALSEVWLARGELPDSRYQLANLETRLSEDEHPMPILPEGCVEISEEPPIEGQPIPSHFEFYTGQIQGECVLWGAEFWHQQWSSRGLRDRARRMTRLYSLEPVARWQTGSRPARIYYRVTR
jgi:hypothetical protein